MNSKRFPLIGLALATALGAAAYFALRSPAHEDEHGHGHEHSTKAGEAKEEDHAPPAAFRDEAALKAHGITLATAGPAQLAVQLELLGEVQLNADRQALVTPRLGGVVQSVHVQLGDMVKQGQLLAELRSPALADLRGEAGQTKQRLALAKEHLERQQTLWQQGMVSQQALSTARHEHSDADIAATRAADKLAALGLPVQPPAGQDLALLPLRAPIAGTVISRQLSVGEALKEDAPVAQIAALSSVWVQLAVPAQELAKLRVGQTATITNAGQTGTARIVQVGAIVGEQGRMASARLLLDNPGGLWRPGLPVTARIAVAEFEAPVAIAEAALQSAPDGSPLVYIREADHFEPRPIRIGRTSAGQVEVLSGLKPGERYAAANSYLVKAELGKAGADHAH